MFEDRRRIAGSKGFAVSYADDHRGILASKIDLIRTVLEKNRQGIGSADTHHRPAQRTDRCLIVFVTVVFDQVDRDLGICLGIERIVMTLKLCADLLIVFNDAVMHRNDFPV